MEFSFLTDRGAESYGYQWGQFPGLDGSKPLGLRSHFGGSPLLGIVARAKPAPPQYDDLVKWLRIGHRYFDEYAVPKMPDKDREHYQKFFDLARPLLVRLDKANRTMLLPALADGQIGFVLDAKLQSKQFLKKLPPTEKPMPMVEPALVLGVSNAQLLRQACGEYWAVAEGFLDAARHVDPEHRSRPTSDCPSPPDEDQTGRDRRLDPAGQVRRRQGDFPQRGAVRPGGRAVALPQPYRAAADVHAVEGRRIASQSQPAPGVGRPAAIGPGCRGGQALGRSGRREGHGREARPG